MKKTILDIVESIIIATGTFLLVAVVAVGSSITNSLIEGKTPEEAVIILANQLDLVSSRQTANEATTTILTTNQKSIQDAIDALSATNALLEAKNSALEEKATKLDQDIKSTASAIPPPPPADTHIIRVERRDFTPKKMVYSDGEIFRIASLRLYNEGNKSTTIQEIAFSISGACEMNLIWSEAGNGKRLGAGRMINGCITINSLPVEISIPSGESRDIVVMAQMKSPFLFEEKNDFQVQFEGIPNIDQYLDFPITSYLFIASSTPR